MDARFTKLEKLRQEFISVNTLNFQFDDRMQDSEQTIKEDCTDLVDVIGEDSLHVLLSSLFVLSNKKVKLTKESYSSLQKGLFCSEICAPPIADNLTISVNNKQNKTS